MFSNLAQGSILYGIEIKEDINVFTAPIISVSIPRPIFNNNNYGQIPQAVVDIVATINGEKREFKQVPGNAAIANFGSEAFILADSKESLNSYIESTLQTSRAYIANADKYKELIPKYESAYAKLNPNLIVNKDNTIKALEDKVDKLETYLREIVTLTKFDNNSNNNKKENSNVSSEIS